MVRNELRQAKETLAARDAEVEELRARLAEVEELQRKQAELLDLKDSELAAVQQRLAAARTDGQDGDAAQAAATVAEAAPPAQPEASPSSLPWLLGGKVNAQQTRPRSSALRPVAAKNQRQDTPSGKSQPMTTGVPMAPTQ